MSLIQILRSTSCLRPGTALDIGARDCFIARHLADAGYTVDAIDPRPQPDAVSLSGITYRQTTLEDFETATQYDLVVASMVSHMVSYDLPDFIERLKALAKPDGVIFVTLFGDEDAWAADPRTKALPLAEAEDLIRRADLRALYKSVEWREGPTYSGTRKFWHVYRFLLEAQPATAKSATR